MSEHIKIERSGGVLTLTINRPDKKNSLTNQMYKDLGEAIAGAESEAQTRVILLQGEGDSFTAGNDVGEFAAISKGEAKGERYSGVLLRALAQATRPIVAAVQGHAVGVGTTMLLHCDLIVLADNAKLATPFVNLALVPEASSSLLLPARVGYGRAFEMFALGEQVDAQTALAWGLANRVVPADALRATARELAEKLAAKPLGSLSVTKQLMRNVQAMTDRMELEGKHFKERLAGAEAREAFAAFAERRPADFTKLEG